MSLVFLISNIIIFIGRKKYLDFSVTWVILASNHWNKVIGLKKSQFSDVFSGNFNYSTQDYSSPRKIVVFQGEKIILTKLFLTMPHTFFYTLKASLTKNIAYSQAIVVKFWYSYLSIIFSSIQRFYSIIST